MNSVLFVCTANMCRSPLAEGLLHLRIIDEANDWRIASAGTWANDGASASSNSVIVLKDRGYDISRHSSRTITRAMVHNYQLVLVMERGHKEAIRVEFPEAAGRVFMLSEMINQNFSIPDPVGGPLVDYETIANEIDYIIDKGLDKIRQLSKEEEPVFPTNVE